jgi:dTDP-4-amino-4,6-dideoxygalactose transaminase
MSESAAAMKTPAKGTAIPLVNLVALHARHAREIADVVDRVVKTGAFVNGPDCAAFEREFAEYQGVRGALGCANGTDAIQIALRALEIGPGDEVITAANSFVATAEAIALVGATPVFVDVNEGTSLMDPESFRAAITSRTKAVIPVHLYGQIAPMDEIVAIAKGKGLIVIEDAAQAHGASLNGRRAGAFGVAACFSFYPGKNLGALGDGGMVISNDEALLARMRSIANHGASADRYRNDILGTNSRLDTIQAGVLRIKLRELDSWNRTRRERARQYCEALRGCPGLSLPVEAAGSVSAWHLFVIRTAKRKELMSALAEDGIATGIHYPVPVHQQGAFAPKDGRVTKAPVTERICDEILSLPLCPEVSADDVQRISSIVRRVMEAG